MTGYSLEYILDSLTLEQVLMLYDYGMEFEEIKSTILINILGHAMSGKKKSKVKTGDKPDIKKFKALYGNKIKTPKDKLNGK
jgi:hypothetical protein